jgi:hypothetical protein
MYMAIRVIIAREINNKQRMFKFRVRGIEGNIEIA